MERLHQLVDNEWAEDSGSTDNEGNHNGSDDSVPLEREAADQEERDTFQMAIGV